MKTSITLTFKEPYTKHAQLTQPTSQNGPSSLLRVENCSRGRSAMFAHLVFLFYYNDVNKIFVAMGGGIPLPLIRKVWLQRASPSLPAGRGGRRLQHQRGSHTIRPPEGAGTRHG